MKHEPSCIWFPCTCSNQNPKEVLPRHPVIYKAQKRNYELILFLIFYVGAIIAFRLNAPYLSDERSNKHLIQKNKPLVHSQHKGNNPYTAGQEVEHK